MVALGNIVKRHQDGRMAGQLADSHRMDTCRVEAAFCSILLCTSLTSSCVNTRSICRYTMR
ncbi:hypothetical protein E2C01_040429 [Portunus trituberculatus]|uniref:Uncharacterized protein n=1 Tax=Portunus trituberculatus TaxID=210409 RepID=A0A5B7FQR2_PORTR|nr:hypothetical protein [Portunus trituberculatus]